MQCTFIRFIRLINTNLDPKLLFERTDLLRVYNIALFERVVRHHYDIRRARLYRYAYMYK